jgi:predicted acylesterase/phospholipase RssA
MPFPRRMLQQHLDPAALPKRILSLDGGGVRGILTLQYLESIETMLRTRYNDPDLLLSDYFDLIGGTSTGAIIAAGLALGKPVKEIQGYYETLASQIFKKPRLRRLGLLLPRFGKASLETSLKTVYGTDTNLGSDRIKTGLMITAKRMDVISLWTLTNNPRDPYYAPKVGQKRIGNSNLLLWQVVRASTAAPSYFKPEHVVIGSSLQPGTAELEPMRGEFVDGGVSPTNNPSLELLKVALLKGFAFSWRPGEECLMLVSVGTGLRSRNRGKATGFARLSAWYSLQALLSMMDDANTEVETIMQWLSKSPPARDINRQIKRLDGELLGGSPLLRYIRYNVRYDTEWMTQELQHERDQQTLDKWADMSNPANLGALEELGRLAAKKQVQEDHFPI